MKKIILLSFKLIILSSCVQSQSNDTNFTNDIEFEEVGRILKPNELKSELEFKTKTHLIKYSLKNARGKMEINEYDLKSGTLSMTGLYTASQELSVDTAYQENVTNPTFFIPVQIKYYKPIRHGKWLYYDSKGDLKLEEIYEMGKLVNKR